MTAKAREAVLALDQGSSSSRVLAFDASGRVLARAQRPARLSRPRDGWAEHDPLALAKGLESALDEVLARLPRSVEVVGAGLACQRSTVVFCERDSFKPAAPAPSWMDGRAAEVVARLEHLRAEVHGRTGLYLTPYYSAPKIRWFLDRDRRVRALAEAGRLLAAPLSTYLIARLTRGAVVAADPTLAQRTLLMGADSLSWDEDMLRVFRLARELLPEIRPTAGAWGEIDRGGRRIPLLACVGDQQAAALGLGARAEGSAVTNFGTGAFLLVNAGADARRIPGLLTTVGWQIGGSAPVFLQEGTVHAAGTSFEWLADLGLMKDPTRIDEAFRRSRARVLALPAIGGLGAPRWDYRTKTAWFGLTSQTRPADLVRATAEGLCFLLADIAAAMRGGGVEFPSARIAGGLSRAAAMMAFSADLLGVPLERRRETEATALGAASLAAAAAGRPWAEAMTEAPVERTFRPRMPRAEAERRRADWTRFVDAQAALSRAVSLS
ncbi:MAG: glycerol kinase [Elusimicrobia bacterium]|nr:glycerol kinase [Elusimicrobiota bacterium]